MGTLKSRYDGDVKSGSGESVRTRYDDDEKPKSKSVDDTQDYASLGRRAGASSPFGGPKEYISEDKRAEKEVEASATESEPDSVAGKGARNLALEGETPKAAKKAMNVVAAAAPKKESSSSKMSSAKDVMEKARPLPGKMSDKDEKPRNLPGKPEAKSEPTPYSGARTRAGTAVKGREEPSKESVNKAMSSLNEKLKKQYKENEFNFKPSKSPNRSYKSGGTVKSSASSRADGIAQRGKTRGRIY